MGLRKTRLADELRDILAENFQGGRLNDPRLSNVTITAVKLSADLQLASVYFRTYFNQDVEAALKGLQRSKGVLRKTIGDTLRMRRVPELRFFYDESIEYGSRIETLLREIHA